MRAGPATNCRRGASQRPAATVEEAARTYDAAAMAYAAGTGTDTNFPPTAPQIDTLGQPVRASDAHPVMFLSCWLFTVEEPLRVVAATHPACSNWSHLNPKVNNSVQQDAGAPVMTVMCALRLLSTEQRLADDAVVDSLTAQVRPIASRRQHAFVGTSGFI
jgi:hypothetical protein